MIENKKKMYKYVQVDHAKWIKGNNSTLMSVLKLYTVLLHASLICIFDIVDIKLTAYLLRS